MKLSDIKLKPLIDTLRLENISDDEYFSEKYSDYVSNSRLSLINPEQGGTPEDYFEKRPKQRSDSLRFGSAVHELVLQKDAFMLVDSVDAPTAKAHYMAEYLFDIMKEKGTKNPTDEEIIEASNVIDYYKDLMTDKKIKDLRLKCNQYWLQRFLFEHDYKGDKIPIFLDVKSKDKLNHCLDNIEKDADIQKLLHPDYLFKEPIKGYEQTILLDVEVNAPDTKPFVLRLKSKLDNYTIDFDDNAVIVNDLKTSGKPVAVFKDSITKYHYYREIAMYTWLLLMCAKKFYNMKNIQHKGNFLVVETFPEYSTCVYPMTEELFNKGLQEFQYLLKLVAFYSINGKYRRTDL